MGVYLTECGKMTKVRMLSKPTDHYIFYQLLPFQQMVMVYLTIFATFTFVRTCCTVDTVIPAQEHFVLFQNKSTLISA